MGEITDFVELYVENSDILPDAVELISSDLEDNMKSNLWVGHGYDKGELYRDITAKGEVSGKVGTVIGWYTVEHGDYVIRGVRGKGKAKAGKIDFLGNGLKKTLEMYK